MWNNIVFNNLIIYSIFKYSIIKTDSISNVFHFFSSKFSVIKVSNKLHLNFFSEIKLSRIITKLNVL